MAENKDGTTTDEEKLVGKELAQYRARLDAANEEIDRRVKEIANLKLANAVLKDRADAEVRGKLITDIKKVSDHGIEFLSECSIERLEQILEDSKMIRKPLFSSSGDYGKGPDPQEKLHTMFKFSKRKGQ